MAESSKNISKLGKKTKLAMEAAMRSTLTGLPCVSEPGSDDIAHAGLQDTSDPPSVRGSQSEGVYSLNTTGSSVRSRNTRGPSLCKGMSYGSEEKTSVQFNVLG